jgi:hypothetical protein
MLDSYKISVLMMYDVDERKKEREENKYTKPEPLLLGY